ncbi:hypothetical protein LIER_09249 [Lithospermum erythrorhizon]|uniref:HMA domain-containing protein n=1 Tax=Lithospermum erythrorhizon TaxID=34254 RepID=A0AAV3PG65_LITER
MDCEGCERKVRKSVEGMKGVTQINVEQKKHRLTVSGYIDPDKVLHRVRHHTGKKAEFWPYGSGGYDNKAPPPSYVLNVHANPHHYGVPLARASSIEVKYYSAFSDENANACYIM